MRKNDILFYNKLRAENLFMKKIRIALLFITLLAVVFTAFACTEKKPTLDTEGNEVEIFYADIDTIEVNNATDLEETGFLYDTFKWSDISVHITYLSEESVDIPLNENMIKAESKVLVTGAGLYTIKGSYGKFDFEFKLKLYGVAEDLFSVAFYNDDGDSAIGSVLYCKNGDVVNPPVMPTKVGYTQVGWREKDGTALVTDFTIHRNCVFVAVYEPDFYEVRFYYTVGEKSTLLKTATIARGGDATEYAPGIPVLAGYSNGRWSDEESMKSVGEGNTDFYIVYDTDKVLVTFTYYKYIEGTYYDYDISWNVNAETEGISPPDDVERIDEYVFLYWYVERGGKEIIVDFPYVVTGEMKFTAKYVSYEEGSEQLTYTLDDTGTRYEVSGLAEEFNEDVLVIPMTHLGLPVSRISDGAFAGRSVKKFSVSPNNSYFRAYDDALYNADMSELIAYPSANEREIFTVTSATRTIRPYAFFDADNLKSVTLGLRGPTAEDDSYIGTYAFAECDSLVSLNIPITVRMIPEGILSNCDSLTSVTIGNRVTEIGDRAFYGAAALESIVIPGATETIGEEAFAYCNALRFISVTEDADVVRPVFRVYNGSLYGYNEAKTNEYYYLYAYPSKYAGGTNVAEYSLNPNVRVIKKGAFVNAALVGIVMPAVNSADTEITFEERSVVCPALISMRYDTGKIVLDEEAFGDYKPDVMYTGSGTNIVDALGIEVRPYGGLSLYYDFTDGFAYAREGEEVEIIAYKGIKENLVIPDEINKFKVVSIKDRVFAGDMLLKSVSISDNVRTIGKEAFYGCVNLTEVSLGAGIVSIGDDAFADCGEISYSGGAAITQYGNNAFGQYSVQSTESGIIAVGSVLLGYEGYEKEIIVPDTIRVIAKNAFIDAPFLSVVDLSEALSLTDIQEYAFYGCEELISIVFPYGLARIGEYAFAECLRLVNRAGVPTTGVADTAFEHAGTVADPCFVIDGNVLTRYNGRSPVVVLPEGITVIGERAFYGNEYLKIVIIGDEVTEIKGSAFYACDALQSVVFGVNVTTVGSRAFAQCENLSDVDFSTVKDVNTIAYDAFDDTEWLVSYIDDSILINDIFYKYQGTLNELHIMNAVTVINERAFYGDSALDVVHFPESIFLVGKEAFAYSAVSRFDFSAKSGKIAEIGESAFEGCLNLAYLDIRNLTSLQIIGERAFKGISSPDPSSLNIYIPASVLSIGEGAFEKSDVKSVKFADGSRLSTLETGVFADATLLESVIFEGKSNLTEIGVSAFENCISLKVFSCTEGAIEAIRESAFKQDNALTIFNVNDDRLLTVELDAFLNNKFIEEDDDTMVFIGSVIVKYNGKLSDTVVIPAKATAIGNSAFKDNLFIRQIVFTTVNGKSNLKEIQDGAFEGCKELRSVEIPGGVKYIGERAFAECTELRAVTFGEDVETIGDMAFFGCTAIENVDLPSGLKTYGGGAFAGCSRLTGISVEENAFYYAESGVLYSYQTITDGNSIPRREAEITAYPSGLEAENGEYHVKENVTINGVTYNVKKIGKYAFAYCESSAVTKIHLNRGLTTIGEKAFAKIEADVLFADSPSITRLTDYAFAEYMGTEIILPSSITEIGNHAFENADNLSGIDLLPSVKKIGSFAFSGTDMTIVWSGVSGLQTVEPYAFVGYTGDRSSVITIPASVTDIGAYAFEGVKATIALDAGLTEIGEHVFAGYEGEGEIVIPDTVVAIRDFAFKDVTKTEYAIVLPAGTTSVGRYAFENVTTSVLFDDNATVKTIDNYAFAGYLGKDFVVPAGVISIAAYAFYGCEALQAVRFDGNNVRSIGKNAFASSGLEFFDVPDSVTEIGDAAFSDCRYLSSLCFGANSSLLMVGSGVLEDSKEIRTVILPFIGRSPEANGYLGYWFGASSYTDNVEKVPQSLEKVTVLGGTVRANSFYGCSDLDAVLIRKDVRLFEGAFVGCTGLSEAEFPYGGVLGRLFGAEKYTNNGSYVPASLHSLSIIGVDAIENYAMYYCNNLRSVSLPDTLTTIGDNAFFNCSRLETFEIGKNVVHIGENAFSRCSSLSDISVDRENEHYVDSDGVLYSYDQEAGTAELILYPQRRNGTEYSVQLFIGSTEYTVTKIKGYAFYYSTLSVVNIPETIVSIGEYAFYGSGITYARILTDDIGLNAYRSCKQLKSLYVENSNVVISQADGKRLYDYATTLYIPYDAETGGLVTSINADTFIGKNYSVSINSVMSTAGNGTSYVTVRRFNKQYAVYTKSWAGIELAISMGTAGGDASVDRNYGKIYLDGEEYIGGSSFPEGTVVTLKATANEDFIFLGWFGSGQVLSLNDSFEYTMESVNVSLSAEFLYLGPDSYDTGWTIEAQGEITDEAGFYVVSSDKNGFEDNRILVVVGEGEVSSLSALPTYSELQTTVTGVKASKGITSIGSGVFAAFTALKDIWLDETVTEIQDEAFMGDTALRTLVITNGVTIIGVNAFANCTALTNVTLGSSVREIAQLAFANTILSSITLPESVTSVESDAFDGCTRLKNIFVEKENEKYIGMNGALYTYDVDTKESVLVLLPEGRTDSFTIEDRFDVHAEDYVVTGISARALYNCAEITEIFIPDSVTKMGESAFALCGSLREIHYDGTIAEWNRIEKGQDWDAETGAYTVTCSDGIAE